MSNFLFWHFIFSFITKEVVLLPRKSKRLFLFDDDDGKLLKVTSKVIPSSKLGRLLTYIGNVIYVLVCDVSTVTTSAVEMDLYEAVSICWFFWGRPSKVKVFFIIFAWGAFINCAQLLPKHSNINPFWPFRQYLRLSPSHWITISRYFIKRLSLSCNFRSIQKHFPRPSLGFGRERYMEIIHPCIQ